MLPMRSALSQVAACRGIMWIDQLLHLECVLELIRRGAIPKWNNTVVEAPDIYSGAWSCSCTPSVAYRERSANRRSGGGEKDDLARQYAVDRPSMNRLHL
jgi:hypothetical protein